MSIGIGAIAKLSLQDEDTIIYQYCGYNLNDERYYNKDRKCDGLITIKRDCLIKAEIHEKVIRTASKRKKLVTKRIPVVVDFEKLIRSGQIVVENCSNCWRTTSVGEKELDIAAINLLEKIFLYYQENDCIPIDSGYYK